jgi:hypothetical protein
MAISTKYRRKITVIGRNFVWYVRENPDELYQPALNVISDDKHFIVTYTVNQPNETRHLVIKGNEFKGLVDGGRCWKRVLCPQWEEGSTVTPNSVHILIEWCFGAERSLVLFDWQGQRLSAIL